MYKCQQFIYNLLQEQFKVVSSGFQTLWIYNSIMLYSNLAPSSSTPRPKRRESWYFRISPSYPAFQSLPTTITCLKYHMWPVGGFGRADHWPTTSASFTKASRSATHHGCYMKRPQVRKFIGKTRRSRTTGEKNWLERVLWSIPSEAKISSINYQDHFVEECFINCVSSVTSISTPTTSWCQHRSHALEKRVFLCFLGGESEEANLKMTKHSRLRRR